MNSVSVDILSCTHACHSIPSQDREILRRKREVSLSICLGLQLAYECSCVSLEQLHSKWRDVLNVGRESEDSVAVKHLESAVGLYLKRVCCNHDTTDIVEVTYYNGHTKLVSYNQPTSFQSIAMYVPLLAFLGSFAMFQKKAYMYTYRCTEIAPPTILLVRWTLILMGQELGSVGGKKLLCGISLKINSHYKGQLG